MRAITVWQPYASAIAFGVKRIETRHWSTPYRGPIAIHAAQRWSRNQREFAKHEHLKGHLPTLKLPLGAIVCVANLIDVKATHAVEPTISNLERTFGDFSPCRFAWILADIEPLAEPIPYAGQQGFFSVPDELLTVAA